MIVVLEIQVVWLLSVVSFNSTMHTLMTHRFKTQTSILQTRIHDSADKWIEKAPSEGKLPLPAVTATAKNDPSSNTDVCPSHGDTNPLPRPRARRGTHWPKGAGSQRIAGRSLACPAPVPVRCALLSL